MDTHHTHLFMGTDDSNSRLCACVVNSLLTESSPQAQVSETSGNFSHQCSPGIKDSCLCRTHDCTFSMLPTAGMGNPSLRNADQMISEVSSDSYILGALLPSLSTGLAAPLSCIFHWWEDSSSWRVLLPSGQTCPMSYLTSPSPS